MQPIADYQLVDWQNPISDHSLNHGLVRWWLEPTPLWGTNKVSELIGGANASFTAGMDRSSWRGGHGKPIGGSLYYNGSTSYATANDVWNSTGPITFSFWVYSTSNRQNASGGYGTSDTNDRIHTHVPWSDGKIYWDYGNLTTGRLSTSYAAYLGKWTYLSLVSAGASGSYMGIYADGKLVTSKAESDGPDGSVTMTFGKFSTYEFAGNMADIRMHNRVLGANEIRTLYQESLQGNPTTLNRAAVFPGVVAAAPPAAGHPAMRRIRQNRLYGMRNLEVA